MKIAILTAGSRGDVQPFIALAEALGQAGHSTRLITHDYFGPLARAHGVELVPAGPADWPTPDKYAELRNTPEGRQIRWSASPGQMLALVSRFLDPRLVEYARHALPACQDVDVIAGGSMASFVAHAIAERRRVPFVLCPLVPNYRSREFPSPLMPPGPWWLPGYNRLSHKLADAVLWKLLGAGTNHVRRDLGLAPFTASDYLPRIEAENPPGLFAVSPSVLPKPRDWPARIRPTGYWFLDPLPGWEPPRELVEFLAAGPTPVCIGLGSMLIPDAIRWRATLIEALDRAGLRAVLLTGTEVPAQGWPGTVLALHEAPHAWLYPRVSAVLHHGGAGTSAAAFRAGVPQVFMPFMGDQPFWAHRARRLGVASRPLSHQRVSPRRLAAALTWATTDPKARERARRLGERVRAEDGRGEAVRALEQVAGV